MKCVISGIVTGFRIRKAGKDVSDFGVLDLVQPGDKETDTALILIYVQDIVAIEFLLSHYSQGSLRWIDTYCLQIQNGRELIWTLKEILHIGSPHEDIDIEPSPYLEDLEFKNGT